MNLMLYYRVLFTMAQHHKYDIGTIEAMLPYERDIYFDLILEYIEKRKEEESRSGGI